MQITFSHDVAIEQTMVFDHQYEKVLQLTTTSKRELLQHCITVWLYCDGSLAGEIYGLSPKRLWVECEEDIEDTSETDDRSLYVFSTTILPEFGGRGLATILKAYFKASPRRAAIRRSWAMRPRPQWFALMKSSVRRSGRSMKGGTGRSALPASIASRCDARPGAYAIVARRAKSAPTVAVTSAR